MFSAILSAAFSPRSLWHSRSGRLLIERYGWALIALRWLYYSAVFWLFRDYGGDWRPFVAPPFGLDLDTYARLQMRLAVPFGFLLMAAIAAGLWAFLRLRRAALPSVYVLNALGAAFFLPFVVVQFGDLAILAADAWTMPIVVPLHTSILAWEAVAAVAILDAIRPLGRADRIAGAVLVMGTWILITGPVWR